MQEVLLGNGSDVRSLCLRLFSFAVLLLFYGTTLLRCDTIGILSLDVVVEDCKCLVNFLTQFVIVVNPEFVSIGDCSRHFTNYLQRHQF